MHIWGEDVDWEGINKAAVFVGNNLRRWGRIGVTNVKEKYGTVRVYCHLGFYGLHDIVYPGYCHNHFPSWLWKFDIKYCSWIYKILNRITIPYQRVVYRFFYKRAVKKWPHLKEEILSAADYSQLLKDL